MAACERQAVLGFFYIRYALVYQNQIVFKCPTVWRDKRGGGTFVIEILFASCLARSEGAAVWGSFLRHRGCAVEGVPRVADWHGLHTINRVTKNPRASRRENVGRVKRRMEGFDDLLHADGCDGRNPGSLQVLIRVRLRATTSRAECSGSREFPAPGPG